MPLKPPADLGRHGRRFLRDVGAWLEANRKGLDVSELEVLHGCCRSVDRLATIAAELATTPASDPVWTRLALAERQIGTGLRIDMKAIGLPMGPAPEKPKPAVGSSAGGRHAAAKRWSHLHPVAAS